VIVPCFSISAPHRLLFHDATLRLVSGRRYGLLGPNGRGKTTLLKYIAARRMPVPPGVSVLMLEQEVAASEVSVVDQVLSADTQRSRLLTEEATLLAFLDSTLRVGECVDESVGESADGSAEEDAGGARVTEGHVAAQGQQHGDEEAEEEENEKEESGGKQKRSAGKKKPTKDSKGSKGTSKEANKAVLDLPTAVERLQAVGAELDAMDAYKSESKARKILTGLGFSDAMQNAGSTTLSGE
jgi:ATPase subunit of ABC transporter with duplicated ATPase domains